MNQFNYTYIPQVKNIFKSRLIFMNFIVLLAVKGENIFLVASDQQDWGSQIM